MKEKCYVAICDEYPQGVVYSELTSPNPRKEAMESTAECRDCGCKPAYVRVKYFTKEELEALPELD